MSTEDQKLGHMVFLGTGTSMGVPTLGCGCAVCRSADPRDKRTQSSVLLQLGERHLLIDTGPDFRQQALSHAVDHIDAVLYTHGHADHILGFDDLRPFTFLHADPLPLFADDATARVLERVFEYTFRTVNRYATAARVQLQRVDEAPGTEFAVLGTRVERIPVQHGRESIAGYRIGGLAYLTDVSAIAEETLARLAELDVLVLDALRHEPHPTHLNLQQAIDLAARIGARSTWFTHISHGLGHAEVEATLPAGMHLAYDGLRVPFRLAA